MARASVVVVCSEACAIKQSPLGGACDSTGVDPATAQGWTLRQHRGGPCDRGVCVRVSTV